MLAWVRADDTRFDGNLAAANHPDIVFSGQDGTVALAMAHSQFPLAQKIELPPIASQTDMMLNVATGKADIVIQDKISALLYLQANPGSLKPVAGIKPLNFLGNTMAVKPNQEPFRRMIDNATRDLMYRGEIDRIVSKYERFPNSLYRVAEPYKSATQ